MVVEARKRAAPYPIIRRFRSCSPSEYARNDAAAEGAADALRLMRRTSSLLYRAMVGLRRAAAIARGHKARGEHAPGSSPPIVPIRRSKAADLFHEWFTATGRPVGADAVRARSRA
jgi:hypothetical protein